MISITEDINEKSFKVEFYWEISTLEWDFICNKLKSELDIIRRELNRHREEINSDELI